MVLGYKSWLAARIMNMRFESMKYIAVTSRKRYGISYHLGIESVFPTFFRLPIPKTAAPLPYPLLLALYERKPSVIGGVRNMESIAMSWHHCEIEEVVASSHAGEKCAVTVVNVPGRSHRNNLFGYKVSYVKWVQQHCKINTLVHKIVFK